MSISTGLGDSGSTELFSGTSVPKDHPQVEFLGALDELNAFLGDAKAAARLERTKTLIESVQRDLFAAPGLLGPSKAETSIDPDHLTALIHEIEEQYPMQGFIIPGKTPASAKLDIARTVCRRAERRLVTLNRQSPVSPHLLRYINRLSDLLFLLARSEEHA
ncbi:cob(I)yrinic acid a,c-diamide adenosyltransferase [Treponema primitia]|uniref:cob(I)yrinic acid a,c-diamide adenosyltransferase n=1 Tax=Treponema primitia TaxID=88058 RepID=UPI00398081FE